MGWNAGAATLTVITQSVILADDLITIDVSKAQRNSAMVADVTSGRNGTVRNAIDNDTFV
jgi:hypothetical protein